MQPDTPFSFHFPIFMKMEDDGHFFLCLHFEFILMRLEIRWNRRFWMNNIDCYMHTEKNPYPKLSIDKKAEKNIK